MRTPSAVNILALATTAASLLVMALGMDAEAIFFGGFIPARWSGTLDFTGLGAVPAVLTPLSAILIHSGLLHLGMNILMLVYCGRLVEQVIGARAVYLLYFVGAYVAAIAQWLPDPASEIPMVGASGAISALVGAYALLYGQGRAKAIGPFSATVVHVVWLLAAWIAISLATALISSHAGMPIAAAAHIGGFLAGVALARPLLLWRWRRA